MPFHSNLCQSMPIYANLCQSIPIYANPFQSMPIYANLCQSMPIHSNLCQSMPILPIGVGGWVLLKPEARFLPLFSSVDDGDGRRRRRAVGVHSRCERPRPARPFTCVPSHACSHCPSKRAALYPIRLHSPLPYVCESIHALHPFTMRMAAARACLHSSSFYACESTHARGCLFDPCALTAFLCMRSDPSPPPV